MAENIENDKYWVRNMNSNGDYDYKKLSDSELEGYLQSNPQAQGLMLNGKGQILPYRLSKIDTVKSMGDVSLQGIAKDKVKSYNDYEYSDIRSHAGTFKAMTNVLSDSNITEGTALYDLMVGTLGYETDFAKAGRKASVDHSSASGVMQITKLTFDDYMNRFGDSEQFQYIKNKWNNGKDIEWSDIENNDELNIAFALEIYRDRVENLYGKNLADITHDELGYLYAKYYNTGDKHTDKNGKTTGHTVEEHTKLFADSLGGYIDKYTIGRRYNVDYDLHSGVIQQATAEREARVKEDKIRNDVKLGGAIGAPSIEQATGEEDYKPTEDATPEQTREFRVKGMLNQVINEVNSETQQHSLEYNNVVSREFNITGSMQESFEVNPKIQERAYQRMYDMVNADIQDRVQENARKRLQENKDYQDSFSIYSSPEVAEQLRNVVNGVDANATDDEKLQSINNAVATTQKEIDDMLANMSDEERESYQDLLAYQDMEEKQALNLAYHEELDKTLPEYEQYLQEYLTEYFKPKSDLEYAGLTALTQSIMGKLMLATTSDEAKNILNQSLAGYDAGFVTELGAGLSAMLLDMPIFNAGGAIGNALFKGGAALVRVLGQKALLTGLTKGANIASSTIKGIANVANKTGLTKAGRSLMAKAEAKAATNFVAANNRLARLQIQQLGTSKGMTFSTNLARGYVGGASSFGFHNTASQYTTHFDVNQMDWKSVRNSALLGGSMSFLHPFKEVIPSFIQKHLGTRVASKASRYVSGNLPKTVAALELGQLTLQGVSRAGFVAGIEAPLFDLQSHLLEGSLDDFNYFNAIKEHTGMFLALGLPHMFNGAKLVNKTNKSYNRFQPSNYYGLSSPFRALGRNYNARLEQSDFENIREYTGYDIYNMADIRKLNKTQRADLDARMTSKDMPIGTRNRYLMMVGDANTTVSFGLVSGGRVESINISKDKNGVYQYVSYDAIGRVIESKKLHGYTTSEAVALETMSRHNIEMGSVREFSSIITSSHIEGANIPENSLMQNRQSDMLRDVKDFEGLPFENFEQLEQRALTAIEKSPNLRTDREIELVDSYIQYLVDMSGALEGVSKSANATAVTLNMPRAEIDRVLRLQPEQRTGVDADIYEIYEAYRKGEDVPQNDTFRRVQTEIDAKVRQLEENKTPATDVTPTEEFALLSRMSASQRIQYINRRYTSADGSVEYVLFSDGTEAIRVTEATGNVVYRDANGRDFTPTDAQLREYQEGGNSYKMTSEEAANQILTMQSERLGLIKNSNRDAIEDIEGSVEYTKEDGSVAIGKAKSVDANGNVTLLDGTVVAPENIKTLDSETISKKVDDMMKDEFVPAGFLPSERPSEKTLSNMMSLDFGRFVRTSKLWNPDANLMAIIEGKIAKAQSNILKLQEKLQDVATMEQKTGDDFSATKAKLESDIARQRNALVNFEKIKEQYATDYPVDKINYDTAIRMQRAEAEAKAVAEANKKAEADAEAIRKKQEDNIKKAKERVAKREQAIREKAEREFEREFQKEVEREEKQQKKDADKEKKEAFDKLKAKVEYEALYRRLLDERDAKIEAELQKERDAELMKIEEQEKRIASLDTDGQYAFLHMLLNPFDGAKNGGLNKRFSPKEFTDRMEQFFPEFSKMDMDMESFKMILDMVMRTSKDINRRRHLLTNQMQSVKPGVSLKAKANKTKIEETLSTAESHMQSLLGYMESIGMRMAENGHKEYLNAFTVVRDKIAEGRPLADSIWNLLTPKRSGQPIEVVTTTAEAPKETQTVSTESPKPPRKKTSKRNTEKAEQPTESVEQEKEAIEDERIDVLIEVESLNIAEEFKGNQTTDEVIVEEIIPTETATTDTATKPVDVPSTQPKAKKAPIKVSVKKGKSKDTATTSTTPDVKPEATPKVEREVSIGVEESKSTQFLAKAKGEGLSMSVERARNNSGNLLASKIVEGKRNNPNGWTEEFVMDVNIEGIADNNNLGENWGVFENAYEIRNAASFKNGDIVRIEKKPRITVQIKFDGKGGKEIIFTSELKKGKIQIESLRENYTNDNANSVINRLKQSGITIKWGNLGDFKNNNQEAFFDPKRNEIVLNRNAELSDEAYLMVVLGHEAVHTRMPARGSKEWQGIVKEFSERLKIDAEQWDIDVARKQSEYKENGVELTRDEAIGEILVDWLGKELFTDTGDATPIRETYNSLRNKEIELMKKLQDKDVDKDYVRDELGDVRSTIKLIEDLATTYNRHFTEKPKGKLGKFWESITSILTAKKNAHKGVDFKNDYSINNVMVRAMRALQKAHGSDVTITEKEQYAYIWRNQEKEPYFKEYIESHPERFESYKGKPYEKLVGTDGKLNSKMLIDIQNGIAEKTLADYRTELTSEYREQKGIDSKQRVQFNKKDYANPGTAGSILQAEVIFRASTGDNFVLRTIRDSLGTENIAQWMRMFKDALPKSYERLSKKYGVDLAATDVVTPKPKTKGDKKSTKRKAKEVINKDADVEIKDDWYNQETEPTEVETEPTTTEKSATASRMEEYNSKLYELEQSKPKEPTVQQFEKKFGGKYKFLSQEKKAEWVKEFKQANEEYRTKVSEWQEKRTELDKQYEDVAKLEDSDLEVFDDYEFSINPKKMSGVDVDKYWRTVVNNMALEAKNRQEFFDNAYSQIMQHISNHPMGQLVRTRNDLKDILRVIKNISHQKDMSLAARDKALQEAAKALDTISADVTLENGITRVSQKILETNTRIKAGLNKSEKYASSQKLAFINAAKEGLREPKEITNKITKTENDIQLLNDKLNNGDFSNGETFESVESNLNDKMMRLAGLHVSDTLTSMRSMKRADLKRLNEEFKKAKAELKIERAKANPDNAKINTLQDIINNYADNKLNILNNYMKSVIRANRQFTLIEESARHSLKNLRDRQKQENDDIVKRAIEDMYGTDIGDMPVNSAEFKNMTEKHKYGRKIANAAQKAWGSWDFLLSKMTVQRQGYEGYLKDKASQWHHDAQITTNKLNKESLSIINEAVRNIFGAKANSKSVFKDSNKLLTDVSGNKIKLFKWSTDEFGVKHNTGLSLPTENKDAYWSIGEAVDLVLTSKQAQGRKAIEKSGIRMEDVDAIERILTSNAEYNKHLSFGIALRDGVVKYLGNRAQEVHQELYGLKFIEEENYFPLSIAQTRASKGNVIKKSSFIGQSITPGYMISRSRVTSEYNPQNALDKVIQYTTEMSHWIGFSPEAQKINRLLSNETFARNVKANFGTQFYDRLKEVANIEVGTFSPQVSKNDLFNELFAFTKISKVSLRPITALKQLTSAFTYMGYSADPAYHRDLIKYYTLATKTFGWENVKWCRDNMPRFKERYESGVAGDLYLGDLQAAHANWLKNARNKGYKFGLKMNAYADAVTIAGGSRAVYDYNMRKFTKMGMSRDAAHDLSIRLAEQEFNLTQASNESSYLSYAQASTDSNVIYKTFLAFTTPVFSLGRRQIQGVQDIYRYIKGGKEFRMKREDAYMKKYLDLGIVPSQARIAASKDMKLDIFKDLLTIFGTGALANITFSGASYATKMWAAYRNNNEEIFNEALDELAVDAGYRFVLGSMPDMPIMGTMIEVIKSSIIEGKNLGTSLESAFGKDLVGIPASTISDIWKWSTNLFSDEDRERFDAWSTMFQLPLLFMFGVDPKTSNNFIKCLDAAIDGELDNAIAYALQLPPSQLKLFEEINNSTMAKKNFKTKFGMSREEFERSNNATRGISEDKRREMQRKMNEKRNRRK